MPDAPNAVPPGVAAVCPTCKRVVPVRNLPREDESGKPVEYDAAAEAVLAHQAACPGPRTRGGDAS